MAIQVNGTTVIDNSRQLTNIASVDATTVAALGAAGVGGGGSIELVADGSISAGDPVGITSTGKVKTVSAVETNEFTVQSANVSGSVIWDCKPIGSDKFIIMYRQNSDYYARLKIGTVSNGSVTFGSEVSTGISFGYGQIAIDEANSSFCIYFRYESASYRGYAMAGTYSGTSISLGSPQYVSGQNGQYHHNIELIASNKYLTSSSGNPDFHIVNTSGTSVTSVSTTYSGGYGMSTPVDDNMQHLGSGIVMYNTGSYFRNWYRIDASGSTPSVQHADHYNGGWDRSSGWYDSTNGYYFRTVSDAGAFKLETWDVSNSNPTNWSNVSSYAMPGNGYEWLSASYIGNGTGVITHKGPNADSMGVQKITVTSSGSILTGNVIATSITAQTKFTAYVGGSYIIPYRKNDHTIVLRVINLGSTYFGLIGLSEGNYSNGQTATVTVTSGENSSQSGLTIGQSYGVNLGGTLTAGATPTLGVATASNRLLLT